MDGVHAVEDRFGSFLERIEQSGIREGIRWPAVTEPPVRESVQSFAELLGHGIGRVAELQEEAKRQLQGLASGSTKEVHDVLLAGGKAEIAFALTLEIRNKLINAWQELSRLPV
ncbi:MAG: flagellar hook-basal body complex protein FliE [Planctomycetota bacterium]